MNNNTEKLPYILVKAMDNDLYGLISLCGDKTMFMRLGEFLATMCNQESFIFDIATVGEDGQLNGSPVQVDLLPLDSDELDNVVVDDAQPEEVEKDDFTLYMEEFNKENGDV